MKAQIRCILSAALVLTVGAVVAAPAGTAFTYQGRLDDRGNAASGLYDFSFSLFPVATGGTAAGSPVTVPAVPVASGYFAATLDFGNAFDGHAYWLDISVKTNGGTTFTPLSPRQPLTPSPYSLYAPNAGIAASATTASTATTATTASTVANGAVTGTGIAAGQVVKSLNGLHDAVALAAGPNVSLTTSGNTLTLSAASGGATLSSPFTLLSLAHTGDENGAAYGVAVAGRLAYVANGSDGLEIYDISSPGQPVNVGSFPQQNGGYAKGVAVQGNVAFLAADGGLAILDVTTPAKPTLLAYKSIAGGNAENVAVSGHFAYVAADANGLWIYDVSDPKNPFNVGLIKNGASADGIAVTGNFAYLANDLDGLHIYNIVNPAQPISVAHIVTLANTWAVSVAVSGNYAYVANSDDGLRIYDVSNPTNPVPRGYVAQGNATAVAISGHHALLACGSDGLLVFDVSDPANPVSVATAPEASGLAYGVAASGTYAYVANNDDGLWTCFVGPLASVPATLSALSYLGDGSSLTNLSAGQLAGQLPPAMLNSLWQVGGNAGTPNQTVLGTTDHRHLQLIADGTAVLQLEPSGDVVVDPMGFNGFSGGSLAPGLTFGLGGTEGVASMQSAGANQFGLDFYTAGTSRMSIDKAGSVHVGASSPGAVLDVQADTRINDHDLSLRGDTNHGLGWYGDTKPFGTNQPDGPVVYGYRGGVLGTTENSPKASLTWNTDNNLVQVDSDLSVQGQLTVTGNLTAANITGQNTPGLNYDQGTWPTDTAVSDGSEQVLAVCSNARNAPGFFVIMGFAWVRMNVGFSPPEFWLKLYDTTGGGNTLLTNTEIDGNYSDLLGHVYDTTVALTWVVPITASDSSQSFTLAGQASGGDCDVFARNLSVMYFPRQNN
jgi:hypothetical protein